MAGRFSFMPENNQSKPWFRAGDLDVTTSVLVAAVAVLSLIVWAVNSPWLEPFVLFADDVRRGQLWRLVTWPLVNRPDIWTVLAIALFWYFGTQLEGLLGRNRYAWYLVILTVVPGIFATVVGYNVWGLENVELAILLVFIAEHPQARFFYNIPGWAIAAVIVGLQVLQLVGYRDLEGLLFLFVLLATAAITGRSMGLMSTVHWVPKVPLPDSLSGTTSSGPRRSARGKVRGKGTQRQVVRGPWQAPPPPPRATTPDTSAAQAELDALLDKIHAHGLESLTADEKRRLNDLSKRLR